MMPAGHTDAPLILDPPAESLRLDRCVCVRMLVTPGLALAVSTDAVTTERRTHQCLLRRK
ncbi:hypothetical protein DMY01_11070 [Cutibacterium avidum]|nr:hypothetical protein DMY01_11070 [Cutibacterium avidum]